MRVHHLNCGTMCPIGRRLLTGTGGVFERGELVCHCLLIETPSGLALVDTGFGSDDLRDPARRIGPVRHLLNPALDPTQTAIAQVQALGFSATDVRHIVLTHLDVDHAGALSDFPGATVHLMAAEKRAVDQPDFAARRRYRFNQWSHGPQWASYEPDGEMWNGFECVRELQGLPPEILLVPLAGHSDGHAAVAVQSSRGWLLHCGDAYFFRGTLDPQPHTPPGFRVFERVTALRHAQYLTNQARLRELKQSTDVQIFSAHDPVELAAFQ